MTTPLEFILGSEELRNSRKRMSPQDHDKVGLKKVCRKCKAKGKKRNCRYCTHRFSQRTWRDKNQTPGELYMGD